MEYTTQFSTIPSLKIRITVKESRSSVVEGLTWDQGISDSSLIRGTVLCPSARHLNPCLVLIDPSKCSYMTKNCCLGLKESTQIKHYGDQRCFFIHWSTSDPERCSKPRVKTDILTSSLGGALKALMRLCINLAHLSLPCLHMWLSTKILCHRFR